MVAQFNSVQLMDEQDTRRAAMVREVQRQPDGGSSTVTLVPARASTMALTRTVRVAAAAFLLGLSLASPQAVGIAVADTGSTSAVSPPASGQRSTPDAGSTRRASYRGRTTSSSPAPNDAEPSNLAPEASGITTTVDSDTPATLTPVAAGVPPAIVLVTPLPAATMALVTVELPSATTMGAAAGAGTAPPISRTQAEMSLVGIPGAGASIPRTAAPDGGPASRRATAAAPISRTEPQHDFQSSVTASPLTSAAPTALTAPTIAALASTAQSAAARSQPVLTAATSKLAATCVSCSASTPSTPHPVIEAVVARINSVLDTVINWLSSLPANPITVFVEGALQQVRRALTEMFTWPIDPVAPTYTTSNQLPAGDTILTSPIEPTKIGKLHSFLEDSPGVSITYIPASKGGTTFTLDVMSVPVGTSLYKAMGIPESGLLAQDDVLNRFALTTNWYSSCEVAQAYANSDWGQSQGYQVVQFATPKALQLIDLGDNDTLGYVWASIESDITWSKSQLAALQGDNPPTTNPEATVVVSQKLAELYQEEEIVQLTTGYHASYATQLYLLVKYGDAITNDFTYNPRTEITKRGISATDTFIVDATAPNAWQRATLLTGSATDPGGEVTWGGAFDDLNRISFTTDIDKELTSILGDYLNVDGYYATDLPSLFHLNGRLDEEVGLFIPRDSTVIVQTDLAATLGSQLLAA